MYAAYDEELAERLLQEIADGMPVSRLKELKTGLPDVMTINSWRESVPSFAERWSRARKAQATKLAEDTIAIADTIRDPTRAKVMVSARQWLAGKLDRETWGDRVDVQIEHKVDLAASLASAKARIGAIEDRMNDDDSYVIDLKANIPNASTDKQSDDGALLDALPDFFD